MYCVFTDLFRVIVELGVCETDAGAVQRDPGAPLHPHHQRTHREDHAQDIHVVRCQVFAGLSTSTVLLLGGIGVRVAEKTSIIQKRGFNSQNTSCRWRIEKISLTF